MGHTPLQEGKQRSRQLRGGFILVNALTSGRANGPAGMSLTSVIGSIAGEGGCRLSKVSPMNMKRKNPVRRTPNTRADHRRNGMASLCLVIVVPRAAQALLSRGSRREGTGRRGVLPRETGRLLLSVAVQRERDQAVQQLAEADSTVLPHLGVHADGGEARDGIDLVDVELVRGFLQKEIDARHAFALHRSI